MVGVGIAEAISESGLMTAIFTLGVELNRLCSSDVFLLRFTFD